MNSDLGEVLFESRPSIFRRIALSIVLLPVGISLTLWSFLFAGTRLGLVRNADWDQIPTWFLPVPLAMGALCLFADWWYLKLDFRCHTLGVLKRGPIRSRRLAFREMKGVRMRLTEAQYLGIIPVLRSLEVWFDALDANGRSIAFDYVGFSKPLKIARQITSIVESAGITPVWEHKHGDRTMR